MHTRLNLNQERIHIPITKLAKIHAWIVSLRKTQLARIDMLNAVIWEVMINLTNANKRASIKSNSMRFKTARYHANKRCSTCTLSLTKQNLNTGTDVLKIATS
jgi:Tfp pilus assembly protein PilV